jgi:hypothetical protein
VKKRERESVSGDLLEEYREVILPARGRWRANLWYLKQALSFVSDVGLGLAVGIVLSLSNLASTIIAPLAEDTPFRVRVFFGTLMLVWSFAGFAGFERTRRFVESAKAGAVVGVISAGIFHITAVLRLNLFLETVSRRSDWEGLLLNFRRSNFESLRAYANYAYLQQTLLILLLGVLVGGVCGTLGGVVSRITQNRTQISTNS